jgi:hypothetical protein
MLGDGEFDVADLGGSGLVGGDRDRAVPGGDEEVSGICCYRRVFLGRLVFQGFRVVGDRCRAGVGGGDEGAGMTELGQGREGGVPVDGGVGAGLGLVPAEDVFGGLVVNMNAGSEAGKDGRLRGRRCCMGDGGLLVLQSRRADDGSKPPRGALAEDRCLERRRKRRGSDRVRCGPGR